MFSKIINIIISVVGMKFLLRKYIVSAETIFENGKKITVLTLNGPTLLKDGFPEFHLAGGLFATVGNTVLVLDCVKSNTTANDFGFFMNHEIGHLVLGHVAKVVKAGASDTVLNVADEVAADNYARSKGYNTPNFRNLLTVVYSELASAEVISEDEILKCVEETLEGHASRM